MADEDRAKYGAMCAAHRNQGGCPEWVEVDIAELFNEAAGLIEQVEDHFDLTPTELKMRANRGSIKALRAVMWIARQKAGCTDDPRTWRPLTQDGFTQDTDGDPVLGGIVWERTETEQKRVDALLAAQAAGDVDPPVPANRADRRAAAKATGKSAASGS
jgi:hypothetical protein